MCRSPVSAPIRAPDEDGNGADRRGSTHAAAEENCHIAQSQPFVIPGMARSKLIPEPLPEGGAGAPEPLEENAGFAVELRTPQNKNFVAFGMGLQLKAASMKNRLTDSLHGGLFIFGCANQSSRDILTQDTPQMSVCFTKQLGSLAVSAPVCP